MPDPAIKVTHLECVLCNKKFAPAQRRHSCDCGGPLQARYDLARIREIWDRKQLPTAPNTMWRYLPVLPVEGPNSIISLGEGMTPLLRIEPKVWLKDEGLNPTGSFEARGLSCALSMCRELGVREVAIAGDGAGACSAYAAAAGLDAHVFLPRDVSRSIHIECKAYGAHVHLVDGPISRESEGWFDLGTAGQPYRIEGLKTMGYEIAEQLGWRLPDAILYPAGGIGPIAISKAFDEMEQLGWISSRRPKMIAVEPEGSDVDAGIRLAKGSGVLVSAETALCLPALERLRQSGVLKTEDEVVILNTASGLKYLDAYATRFPQPAAGEQDKLGGLITPR